MSSALRIYRVAVPSPLRRIFDYLPPQSAVLARPGARVRVPFGKRVVVGVVIGTADQSEISESRLKPILDVLDPGPLLPDKLLKLLVRVADYYQHPIGEVIHSALPLALRRGKPATIKSAESWVITPAGRLGLASGNTRPGAATQILKALADAASPADATVLAAFSKRWRQALRSLVVREWVAVVAGHRPEPLPAADQVPAPDLSAAQKVAVAAITDGIADFHCYLLHGVTGSGKTEVYLRTIAQVLNSGAQVLVLVPEIGLTPQLVARFRQRFPGPIAVIHSGLNDSERLNAWLMARDGTARIVLGTRSAVFVPMQALRLIVIDEEHDSSYKQQDGFRYSARDVAIMRAQREGVPVVLGSATPSLESLHNANEARYTLLALPERTGQATLPPIRLLDLRRLARNNGLAPPLIDALRARLARQEQSLLFINRRGYAPVLMCHDCGWLAPCPRCDARLTLHKAAMRLRCHHCGGEAAVPPACPVCHGVNLHGIGEGTERVEAALTRLFPAANIERIDRDSTRGKGVLQEKLDRVLSGEADILVGTQMLAKGHDFPNLTLVGVLNADQGLYGSDFRSAEQLFQLIMQVAGRAGRADKPGEVMIQTFHPEHPLFCALCSHDYSGFANYALKERREAQYPPFSYLALLRAESAERDSALRFLGQARAIAAKVAANPAVTIMDPVPSPMERRSGRYRAQLLVQATRRRDLHRFLSDWLALLDAAPLARKARWSLDVDPIDLH
ncbi:MAG: primosomal protein N' [Acidiferrobacterales bacterium]